MMFLISSSRRRPLMHLAAGVVTSLCLLLTACQSGVPMSNYSRTPVAWPRPSAAAANTDPSSAPAALVLGVQWLNPLMWRDYPTQWNLLWAQGLAQPNANDTEAKRFKLGDAVGRLVTGISPGRRVEDIPNLQIRYRKGLGNLLDIPLR